MRYASGGAPDAHVPAHPDPVHTPVDPTTTRLATPGGLVATPGLVVVHDGPGSGRSTVLRRLADTFRGPDHTGGALSTPRSTPASALTRAVRVRLSTARVPADRHLPGRPGQATR